MSILQSILGNASEVDPQEVQKEFSSILVTGESVLRTFKLFRDLMITTELRLLVVDKQGITGRKQEITSIPWKSIKKFSCETAGFLDGDGELRIWLSGEEAPMKWEFSRAVNIQSVYAALSQHVLRSN